MPTASSIQISKKSINKVEMIIILKLDFVVFRNTISIITASKNNKIPPIMKSNRSQLTSSVYCIAIKGMSNNSNAIMRNMKSLLLFIIF